MFRINNVAGSPSHIYLIVSVYNLDIHRNTSCIVDHHSNLDDHNRNSKIVITKRNPYWGSFFSHPMEVNLILVYREKLLCLVN